jgi:hypothetical protein
MDRNFLYNVVIIDQHTQEATAQHPFYQFLSTVLNFGEGAKFNCQN